MGNVTGRIEDGGALILRDQSRRKCKRSPRPPNSPTKASRTVSIASLTVLNNKGKILLNVVPNVYPATRVIARKDYGDESLVEYIQVKGSLECNRDSLLTCSVF